jgi:hypothetical protein
VEDISSNLGLTIKLARQAADLTSTIMENCTFFEIVFTILSPNCLALLFQQF